MARMRAAATEKAWRDAAHTLKGSAFAIGANGLARAAADAEAARDAPERWPDHLARIDAEFGLARAFIQSLQIDA